jgi:hypothetical protein
MRYLKTFESFKLLLEKIVKDDDYYTFRQDLDPHVKFILDEFRKLNQKIRSSVSSVKKDNIEETLLKEVNDFCTKYKEENKYPDTDLLGMSQARKLFTSLNKMIIDKLNGTYGNGFKASDYLRNNIFHVGIDAVWALENQYDNNADLAKMMFFELELRIPNILDYIKKIKSYLDEKFQEFNLDKISKNNMNETRSQLASIFYKVMKDIHRSDLPQNFDGKLNQMVGTTFDKKGNLSYIGFTIGSMGQEGKGEIVEFPIKNVEVSGKTISEIDVDSIGKKPLIKIIEFLNELVFSIISPEDPKKLGIKKLLKSGEDPKKVAKKYKLNLEELKELIAQAQGQIESEEIQSAKEDLLKLKEKPKLDLSPEDKKIIDVEEMIEEFREFGKEFFKSNSTSRVNFDIQVDKFKLFLQKKGYEIPIRGDFKQTISTLMINELKNPNSKFKEFINFEEFMEVCLKSSSKKIEKY